jgi:hypothetical protein
MLRGEVCGFKLHQRDPIGDTEPIYQALIRIEALSIDQV